MRLDRAALARRKEDRVVVALSFFLLHKAALSKRTWPYPKHFTVSSHHNAIIEGHMLAKILLLVFINNMCHAAGVYPSNKINPNWFDVGIIESR